jgi:hypothetical protein
MVSGLILFFQDQYQYAEGFLLTVGCEHVLHLKFDEMLISVRTRNV